MFGFEVFPLHPHGSKTRAQTFVIVNFDLLSVEPEQVLLILCTSAGGGGGTEMVLTERDRQR